MGLRLKLGNLENDFECVLAVHLGKNAIFVLLLHTGFYDSIFFFEIIGLFLSKSDTTPQDIFQLLA